MTGWVTVATAATFTGRPRRTVWQWVDDGLVSCRCRTVDRRVEVWFFDVLDLSAVQPTRNRAA